VRSPGESADESGGAGDHGPARLTQPDGRSCGATVAVRARLLLEGTDPGQVSPAWFGAEVRAVHRTLTSWRSPADALRPGWVRALGTPPWTLAEHLGDLTGRPYEVRWCRLPASRERAWARLVAVASPRSPVAVYVGSPALPRHVVLAHAVRPGAGVVVHEPSRGRELLVDAAGWRGATLGLAGWDHPWALVLPAGDASGALSRRRAPRSRA
jgi:hypothetical protein